MRRHTYFAVVGESHYQREVRSLRRREGEFPAVLLKCEPDNKHDSNAVRVCDPETDKTLGYLDRRAAKEYRETVTALDGTLFDAELRGGDEDAPSIGIVIDARPLIEAKHGPLPPAAQTPVDQSAPEILAALLGASERQQPSPAPLPHQAPLSRSSSPWWVVVAIAFLALVAVLLLSSE